MRKVLFIGLLISQTCIAQTTLTLDSCVFWAKNNYPLIQQNDVLKTLSKTNLDEINQAWLPKLSFGAQAGYQTEVIKLSLPGISGTFPHTSYGANLNLQQTIFDGGQSTNKKNIERISSELSLQNNEVQLYNLVNKINQIYSTILLSQVNLKNLNVYKDNIFNNKKLISDRLKNGLALPSDLDELDAALLSAEQNIEESNNSLEAQYKILSIYINKPVNSNSEFSLTPIGGIEKAQEILRPELKMFSLQKELLLFQNKLNKKFTLPTANLNLTGNYGRNGPNFINQDFRFYGSGNISLNWNISSFYNLKREKKRLETKDNQIDIQKEIFLLEAETALTSQEAEILSMESVLLKDQEIIAKRHNVTQTASNQMINGKTTIYQYLVQLNAELSAQLNEKIHQIKLMNAQSNYNIIKGIPNF